MKTYKLAFSIHQQTPQWVMSPFLDVSVRLAYLTLVVANLGSQLVGVVLHVVVLEAGTVCKDACTVSSSCIHFAVQMVLVLHHCVQASCNYFACSVALRVGYSAERVLHDSHGHHAVVAGGFVGSVVVIVVVDHWNNN